MLYLVLSALTSVLVANLVKIFSDDKKTGFMTVYCANYLFAFIMSGYGLERTVPVESPPLLYLLLAFCCGVFLLVSFIVYRANIEANGLSLSVSVMRSSLIVPILVSLVVFGERILFLNYLGIAMVIGAFFLLEGKKHLGSIPLLIIMFFTSGITNLFYKIHQQWLHDGWMGYTHHADADALFLTLSFIAAFATSLFMLARLRQKPRAKDVLYGLALGIPNQLTFFFMLKSLRTVPGAIVFPFLAGSVVVLGFISDIVFWKVRFSHRRWIMFSIILLGIVFLNLR